MTERKDQLLVMLHRSAHDELLFTSWTCRILDRGWADPSFLLHGGFSLPHLDCLDLFS